MYDIKPALYDDKPDLYDDMTDLYDDMTDLYDDMTDLYAYPWHVWYQVIGGGRWIRKSGSWRSNSKWRTHLEPKKESHSD